MKFLTAILVTIFLSTTISYAHSIGGEESLPKAEQDSTQRRNLRFSALGGPGYTPDFGFLVGGSALFTFSMDRADSTLQRSVVPFAFGITFAKPMGLNIQIKPQLFFKGDKVRMFGSYLLKNSNDNYYGVGFDENHNAERGEDLTQYTAQAVQINPVMMFRVARSDFFVGPSAEYYYEKITNPGSFITSDATYLAQGGDSLGIDYTNIGIGFRASYDTRDVVANPYKGIYFAITANYYNKAFGGDFNYGNISFDYRQYQKLSPTKRRVLAWTAVSNNAFGDVPFTQYSQIGSPFDLRGYYKGQYRNYSTAYTMAEYRHMFEFGNQTTARRVFSKFGFATWGGLGFLGSNIVKYEAVLPNLGAGLRIELQPRMNFRLDVGRNIVDKQNLVYFNMTEAF